MKWTKQEILELLNDLHNRSKEWYDDIRDNRHLSPEDAHQKADDLLLEYINDEDITKAFEQIERWYS